MKRFINIINNANLRLEKCIIKELEKNCFIIECIHYNIRNKIKENGIKESVKKAVKDRDEITHNNTLKLDSISIGVYDMLLKLNYAMILEHIGVTNDVYSEKIKYLGLVNII